MDYGLQDLIDIPKLQSLLDSLYVSSGIPSAIIDLEGKVLTWSGGADLCNKFHRINPDTLKDCIHSDVTIAAGISSLRKQAQITCPRGLTDTATPLVIEGRHLANVFTGQVFISPPDREFFRQQAAQFNFDEAAYVGAVDQAPLITQKQLDEYLAFLALLTEQLAIQGLTQLRTLRTEAALRQSEARYRRITEGLTDYRYTVRVEGGRAVATEHSQGCEGVTGYKKPEDFAADPFLWFNLIATEDHERARARLAMILAGEEIPPFEHRILRKDGTLGWVSDQSILEKDASGRLVSYDGIVKDITEIHRALEELREAQQTSEQVIACAQEGVIVYGPDLRYQVWNPFMEQLSGLPASEVLGRHPLEVFPFLREAGVIDRLERALAGENVGSVDFPFQLPGTGKTGWTTDTSAPFRNARGEIVGVIGTVSDITTRKQVEEALTQSEARHSAMVANISDVIGIIGVDGTMKYKSPNIQKCFGWEPQDLIGTDGWLTVHPDDLERIQKEFQTILEQDGASAEVEYRYKCKDGSYKYIGLTATNLMHDPAIAGVLLNYHDITERNEADEGRREAEWKFRALFEKGPIGVAYHRMIYDASGRPVDYYFIDANQKYIDLTGVDPRGRRVTEAFPGIEHDPGFDWMGTFGHVAKSGESIRFESYLQANKRWYDCVGYQYKPDHFVAAFLEITERKQAEVALTQSEATFRKLFEDSSYAILLIDGMGIFVECNQAALDLLRMTREQFILLPPARISPEFQPNGQCSAKAAPEMLALAHSKGFHRFDWTCLNADGDEFIVDVSLIPVTINGQVMLHTTWNDITDRKRAEAEKAQLLAQLQQSQKMESLGTLAGGVAHDMNNVLGAILGLASAHIGTQPYGSPFHQALDTICKATERGGKMVKSLLSFARQSPAENHKLDMNAILKEQVSLLERTTLANVHLEIDLEANLRPILGDASALTHAFMNLCVNAVDAMPDNGTLTLRTRNVDNDWIEVVVEDNGMGMPKEVLEKAMDPFFTTKGIGKGTGLGLSMVFSTVKAHRGQMAIESEPDKGTRVKLRFPACEQEIQVQAAALAVDDGTLTTHGSMKVLLVDDDDLIQTSVQMILEVMGHTAVTTASNGEEALAILEAGFEPDLVILDMNMPGLGGIGTLPRLRVLRPVVPVLLATGRVDQTALTLASAHPGVTLLAKPFGLRELQKHLESIGLG
jgi:PAS domain S-box-containing protein